MASWDDSAPTVVGSSVYVSLAFGHSYAFDRATGAQRWHDAACCAAGGGPMTTVFDGRLFAQDGVIRDTGNGLVVGSWSGGGFPAWSGDTGVGYGYTALRGFGPGYDSTRWRFGIDQYTRLAAPLIAGSHVYTATIDYPPYQLIALRLGDGAPVWCQLIAEPPPGTYPPFGAVPGRGRGRAAAGEQRRRARGVRVRRARL